jgi:protein-L-isoaspartate(D-aspartate) O-methyltransferase
MVDRLARTGIGDPRVLDAMRAVPRHAFIPEALVSQAYGDTALPIGDGQTISAPGIVAAMSQALELDPSERALEVGTGSGYQVSILSHLAAEVISVERVPRLASRARKSLDDLGVSNVVVHLGDGSLGRPADAPFDAILVTAGGPTVPEPLLAQLAHGGRLVGPFGERGDQCLLRVRRGSGGRLSREVLARCRFVDLIGGYGWAG